MVSHSYRSQNGTRVPNLDNCREGCESSVGLSHSGSGTRVSLLGPAPAAGRHWLRYLCRTRSIARADGLTLAGCHPSPGGRHGTSGAFDA
jgi:hypothetical protein